MKAVAIGLGAMLALAACSQPPAQPVAPQSSLDPASLPNGDIAGAAKSDLGGAISNPVEGQPAAIAEGKHLFVQMNCAGCHGYTLGGSMGPNLTDRYWRYGGSPAAIYDSIASGHPQGMPAWREALPSAQIWELVAYIESFGGATAPSDYQGALQGDDPAKSAAPGNGTGAHAGAKGGSAPAAQTANP